MAAIAFHHCTVILPDRVLEDGVVICRDGKIAAVGSRHDIPLPEDGERIDAGGGFVGPGYVDIHTHGGDGADFMDGRADAVRTAVRAHARHGTTTIFPTTTTGTQQQLQAMLQACLEVRNSWNVMAGAQIGGVHFYGPYFAENMEGAHPRGRSRFPDPKEYLAFFDL